MPAPDGKPLPFACGFTFGEQGPIGKTESMHANLMFNICLFGGLEASPRGAVVAPRGPSRFDGQVVFRRVRQFLLHPDRFPAVGSDREFERPRSRTPREFVATLRRFGFVLTRRSARCSSTTSTATATPKTDERRRGVARRRRQSGARLDVPPPRRCADGGALVVRVGARRPRLF